jgi:hypothetical protein
MKKIVLSFALLCSLVGMKALSANIQTAPTFSSHTAPNYQDALAAMKHGVVVVPNQRIIQNYMTMYANNPDGWDYYFYATTFYKYKGKIYGFQGIYMLPMIFVYKTNGEPITLMYWPIGNAF